MADRVWSYCDEDKQLTIIYYRYISAPMDIMASLFILIILLKYIHAKFSGKMESELSTFLSGLLLFILCFVCLIATGIRNILLCNDSKYSLYMTWYNISSQSYVISFFPLIAILYLRLYYMLKNTVITGLRLSKCTNTFFIGSFGLVLVSAVTAGYFYSNHTSHIAIIICIGIAALLTFAMIIALVYIFIYKLYVVYKHTEDNNENHQWIKKIITQTSLLAIISLFCTVLSVICVSILPMTGKPHFDFIFGFIFVADIMSNVICIILTFNYFGNYYENVCVCCDAKWHQIWTNCTNVDAGEKRVHSNSIPTMSPGSSSTRTLDTDGVSV